MAAEAIGWLGWALLALPTLVLLVELWSALAFRAPADRDDSAPQMAIIVPAHDEAAAIAATIASLRTAVPARARLLVVADNCSDATAAVARQAGAEVIERHDANRHGKGYALAFARDHLAMDPPDVAIIFDADCRAEPGAIVRIATIAQRRGRPVQARYLMRPDAALGAMVALSGFAFMIRNDVRQRGIAVLGAPALLTGSGMAFPWALLATAPLAGPDIVEDLSLGLVLGRAGHAPLFAADATIWSEPARRGATFAQRTRWERGFLATAMAQAPGLIVPFRWPLSWLGLHLLVPPLAMLGMGHLLLLATCLVAGAPGGLLLAAAFLPSALAAALLVHWMRSGRSWLSGATLLLIPLYMLWKLPIYIGGAFGRGAGWTRTRRD